MTQSRWRQLTEWPLAIAAVIFLVAYSWQVIADLRGELLDATELVIWITWAVFAVDYVVNLILAPNRRKWFFSHLFDLLVVVLPMLRPLRLLRLVTLFNVLQRTVASALRGRVVLYAATASVLLVYVAALAVLDAERGAGGSIQTFPDALWWAFVTITTVGYGDFFPVTNIGRFVAVAVMVGGIALIGIVTATLASWIVERVTSESASAREATRNSAHEIASLADEVRELRAELRSRSMPRASDGQAPEVTS